MTRLRCPNMTMGWWVSCHVSISVSEQYSLHKLDVWPPDLRTPDPDNVYKAPLYVEWPLQGCKHHNLLAPLSVCCRLAVKLCAMLGLAVCGRKHGVACGDAGIWMHSVKLVPFQQSK